MVKTQEQKEAFQKELVRIYRNNPSAAARDILGIDLAPHQRVAINEMWTKDNVILTCSRGLGKCVDYDTLCITDGGFYKIGDMHKSEKYGFNDDVYEIFGENGINSTSHTFKNQPEPVYTLQTRFGYSLKAVAKHTVRCIEDGKIIWKRMDDIQESDIVLIDRCNTINFAGDYNWITEDEAYLIGALIGDGCFVKPNGVGFTNIDEDILDEFRTKYKILGATNFTSMKERKEFCLLFGNKSADNKFFEKYKIKREKSNLKEIPESILRSTKRSLAAFISGYADTDGGVTKDSVEFSSCSEKLIAQLQTCLLLFGIVSKVRLKKVKYNNTRNNAWILSIFSDNRKIFLEEIGFKCKRKQQKLIKSLKDVKCNPNCDTVKNCKRLLLDIRKEAGKYITLRNEKRIPNKYYINKYNLSYKKIETILDTTEKYCKNMESWQELKRLCDKKYFMDEVKTISKGKNGVTYDVHIPNDHTFISNGFISHNTFLDALFAVLRALLFPGEKVGIMAPSFRQAKFVFAEVEKMYDMSPDLRDACAKKPVKGTDMCYLDFAPAGNKPGSVIHALPLGDGGKIRGARYFTIVADEVAQIPKEILDVVVRGMMATAKNPMESVKFLREQKRLLAEGKIEKIQKLHNNKIVFSSTAYYQYNHFWDRVDGYQQLLLDKYEKAQTLKAKGLPVPPELRVYFRGHDINDGQIAYNVMCDEDRALLAFNKQDAPEGFMNEESILEAKREMPRYQYMMEYFCYFPADSDGFFPRSLLDKAQSHRNFVCELTGDKPDPNIRYIMGIDPARQGDNCVISIMKVLIKEKKVRLVRIISYNKKPFPEIHLEIRKWIKVYNISEIAMDSGGGGHALRDLLADKKACPPGEDVILQRGFDEHRMMKGKRILQLSEFSKYEWVHDSNHNLLLSLQNGSFEIPCEKGALLKSDSYVETFEEEEAYKEIEKTIDEMQNIVIKTTTTGRMHWDTPQKKQKKDRYSATLIGHDMAYMYINNLEKPQTLVSGFWS